MGRRLQTPARRDGCAHADRHCPGAQPPYVGPLNVVAMLTAHLGLLPPALNTCHTVGRVRRARAPLQSALCGSSGHKLAGHGRLNARFDNLERRSKKLTRALRECPIMRPDIAPPTAEPIPPRSMATIVRQRERRTKGVLHGTSRDLTASPSQRPRDADGLRAVSQLMFGPARTGPNAASTHKWTAHPVVGQHTHSPSVVYRNRRPGPPGLRADADKRHPSADHRASVEVRDGDSSDHAPPSTGESLRAVTSLATSPETPTTCCRRERSASCGSTYRWPIRRDPGRDYAPGASIPRPMYRYPKSTCPTPERRWTSIGGHQSCSVPH